MPEITTAVFMPDTWLDCGHQAPERTPGVANGVAIDTITNQTMCYPCADTAHLGQLLRLETGYNGYAYLRLGHPLGRNQLAPGVVGEVTSWSGAVLGVVIPGTVTTQHGIGFGGVRTERIHFRALVTDGKRNALFYGTGAGDGMIVTLKRMLDRTDPAGEAPHPRTKAGKKVRGR